MSFTDSILDVGYDLLDRVSIRFMNPRSPYLLTLKFLD